MGVSRTYTREEAEGRAAAATAAAMGEAEAKLRRETPPGGSRVETLRKLSEGDASFKMALDLEEVDTGSSDKAGIAVSEVVFAGHVVGNGQRKPIPGKVAAIEHWEKPKTVSELRSYLGFCNYYSGYIKMYA